MANSGKPILSHLADILIAKGVSTVIISPGSRNAPVIKSLIRMPGLTCLSVIDERSAAFFALGIAQQTCTPVAIVCTSGSAPLNYAPAVAEAFYQQIPLVVITADRPPEWIDQGDGQAIRQTHIYANFIRYTTSLPAEPHNPDTIRFGIRLINEAIDAATSPIPGPVHVNIPLSEPLYSGEIASESTGVLMEKLKISSTLDSALAKNLIEQWNKASSKLILTGLLPPNPELNNLLATIAKDPSVAVLTENTSNLFDTNFLSHTDRLIEGFSPEMGSCFVPDLLITLGGNIVSRRVKAWLQKSKPSAHWHVGVSDQYMDTFRSLSLSIPLTPVAFFRILIDGIKPVASGYCQKWKELVRERALKHDLFFDNCLWSDLKAYEIITRKLPAGCIIQAGNSTPVRYLQLFEFPHPPACYSNRGVSGIDGVVSTAAGAAWANQQLTILFSGDLSLFYDSNGLWNTNLTKNLRIIVFNNGGGNIFRIIEGPDDMPGFEKFLETPVIPSIRQLAALFNLDFYSVSDAIGLEASLPMFLDVSLKKTAILEVITQNKTSAEMLKKYFQSIRI